MSEISFPQPAPDFRPPDNARQPPPLPFDRFAEWLLLIQILGATVLQKFALPLGGSSQVFLGLLIMLGATIAGLMAGRMQVRQNATVLYLIMAAAAVSSQLLGGREFSISSLLLLLVIHAPYAFTLKSKRARPGIELIFFQNITAILALLGIVQYCLQYFIGWKWAFYLDLQLPQSLIAQGFHGLNPEDYAGSAFKSNGVFFLEPAMFCQTLAISIVIELVYFSRVKRLCLYLAGVLVTFSGTGLIILLLLVPARLIQKRKIILLMLLICIVVALCLFAPLLGLEDFIDRITEFSNPQSSGYARFISIFPTIRDFILPHTDTLLFGMGAGSIKDVALHVSYIPHDPTWGKIFYEYGMTGALPYYALMLYILFAAKKSPYLKAGLAIQFFFLAQYALTPTVHGAILALLAWPAAGDKQEETPSAIIAAALQARG